MAKTAAKNSGLFERTMGALGFERRSSLENPQTPLSYPAEWLLDIFNGGRTDAGLRVSEMVALQSATVFQCVMIIANAMATNPLNVYERQPNGGKKVATTHPLQYLLNMRPNSEMTSSTLRRTVQCHKLLWGNGYIEIERDNANRIKALWPRNPSRTHPVRTLAPMEFQGTVWPQGTMMYETYDFMKDTQIMEQDNDNQNYGFRRLVLAEDMIHMPGLSLDGRLGQDVVILARQAIGLALASEKFGAKFFGNGAIPTGVFATPGDMTDVQLEVFKRSWAESHGGENHHKTGVLPPGVTYTKTGATPEEGQMLQTRQHQKSEIASFFNVPPHMVGVIDNDAGKSSVEQSSIEFKLFCTDPHATDWEQEMEVKLFPAKGIVPSKFYAGFDMRKLMYPTAEARALFYNGGKQWGYLTTDLIHEMEGLNPAEDGTGQKYWMPINMQDAGAAAAHGEAVQGGLEDGTLAATPAGVTPIGDHPVVKAAEKQRKQDMAQDLQKHQISSNASVQIAKHQAKSQQAEGGAEADKSVGKSKLGMKKSKKRSDLTRVFAGMYRDAVGRASFRKKATVQDYVTVFGPVASAVIEQAIEERCDASDFIRDYTADLFTRRGAGWGEDLDAASTQEFENFVERVLNT
ncbi:Phage portal protein [uncultured archaeon]|nr:Phage portal protein [uncultured archaeon]